MDAAIYARISLDVEGEGLGVARQTQDCEAKARSLGWTVNETYVDNDVSASKAVVRPEYERLMAAIADGSVKALVVYDLDRLTRKPAELESFIDLADKNGVELANVSGDVDLTTGNGRMIARIKGAVARQEADRIGERVRRQKQQRASRGIPHKGRHRLFGYDDNWNLIPSEAAVIAEAFKRRAFGESTTSIANDFTARGVKTVAGRDWKSGTLSVTLTKHVYCGKVTLKGQVIADSAHPAIVDEATFNAAQKNLANDSKGTNARKYLLSGFLVCELCLTPMKGNPSNHMYRCSSTYGGCGRLSVRIALADEVLTNLAFRKHQDAPQKPDVGRDYAAEIKAAEEARKVIQDGYEAGLYSIKEALPKINVIKKQIADLTKEQAASIPTLGIIGEVMEFDDLPLSQRRAFLSLYIDNVAVGPARSRGNQPFDPARFNVSYTDGTSSRPDRQTRVDASVK